MRSRHHAPTSTTEVSASLGASGRLPAEAHDLDRLMTRYAAGEKSAFLEIHKQMAPRLRGFLLRMCGRPALADDLLQEAFLRIHRARGSFSTGAAVLPWSYAIARNVYIDYARQARSRRGESIQELQEAEQPTAPLGASPEAAVSAKETLEVVRATLRNLPETHREAFVLLRFEGLSVAEAAKILDTSESNVKVRAFRAYEAFRAALRGTERTDAR